MKAIAGKSCQFWESQAVRWKKLFEKAEKCKWLRWIALEQNLKTNAMKEREAYDFTFDIEGFLKAEKRMEEYSTEKIYDAFVLTPVKSIFEQAFKIQKR